MENKEQQRRRETNAPERNPNPCPLYRKCGDRKSTRLNSSHVF